MLYIPKHQRNKRSKKSQNMLETLQKQLGKILKKIKNTFFVQNRQNRKVQQT